MRINQRKLTLNHCSQLCDMHIFNKHALNRRGHEQAVREAATICPRPLQVDLLTLKMVSESCVTWATSVNYSLLGLSVLNLGPKYATDRQTDVRRAPSLNAPTLGAGA